MPDYVPVRSRIQALLDQGFAKPEVFINLAYRCASTFRATDYRGGCNGARIRFEPESSWPTNVGTSDSLALLNSIQQQYNNVSYADLIALAGLTSLASMNSKHNLTFCGGAVDATDGNGSDILAPRVYSMPNITVTDDFQVKGLTPEQGVAMASRMNVSSQYYVNLAAAGANGGGNFTADELALLTGDLRAIVDSFAADEALLLTTFDTAWAYLMTADRFLNNRENACTGVDTPTQAEKNTAASIGNSTVKSAGTPFTPSLLSAVGAFGLALLL